MKPNPIPVIAIILLSSITLGAQDLPRYEVLLKSGAFTPEKNITADNLNQFNRQAIKIDGKSFALIQFEQAPSPNQKELLRISGIELLDYVPKNAYTATITALNEEVLTRSGVRSVVEFTAYQKMQPELAKGNFPAWAVKTAGTVDVLVSFPSSFSFETVNTELRNRNFDIRSVLQKDHRLITLRVPVLRLGELALLPFIEYVEAAHGEDQPLNGWTNWGRDQVKVSLLGAPVSQGGKGLKGSGVVVGVGDNADPQRHVDFSTRLITRAATDYLLHGTHVAGIVGGAGIVDELRTGFAPKSTILTQLFSNVFNYAPAYVTDHGMVITNNSYGNNVSESSTFGVYDLYSRILDQQAFSLPNLQNVFAAGNSGTVFTPPYPDSFRTVLGGYQTAKNVITVGNATPIGFIFQTSSRGPSRDGRVKPEIVSVGSFIMSTSPPPFPAYWENTGTSMASPAISGGLALLYEKYRALHPPGLNPPNGLIKALVCNSGDDWGTPGPDYTHGFGMANFWRAVNMLETDHYTVSSIPPGPPQDLVVSVPAGLAELKVMLYWNDPAASPLASPALVNNLDLELLPPSGPSVLPLILDTAQANIKLAATNGIDNINNIEQIVVSSPAAGNYTLRVKATSITQNPSQEYYLVYDFVPLETKLIAPIGGEAYIPGENMIIHWDSYGSPANSFTVEYSNGGPFTPLNTDIPAQKRIYFFTTPNPNEWFIVPNDPTDAARIRITRNGTGLSSTSLPFTILQVPAITLSPVQCEGYFSVNWTTVPAATGYEVMMLQGDEMVSVAILPNTTTTYTISGLSKDSVYWVSVRGLINGKPGRRGIAVSRKPDNGTCVGSIFDNDIKLDSIISPARSGRTLTSTSLGATVPVTIRIKNLDDEVTTEDIEVTYILNAGTPVVETITNPAIPGNSSITYTFGTFANLSALGTYNLEVSISMSGDPVSVNNSLTRVVKQLDNPAITGINPVTPFIDNFDSAPIQTYITPQVGMIGLDRYDFVNSSDTGRIRTFINTGISYSGNRAITLDSRIANSGSIDSLTGTYNLATFNSATHDIRLDFQYKNHRQQLNAANKVWARGDDTQSWIEIYDLDDNQNPVDGTFKRSSSIELGDLLFNALPSQNFSTSCQLRFGQYGRQMAADNDGGAGYTFDDIRLYQVTDDLQMISIDAPSALGCNLTANTTVSITLRNSVNTSISGVPVRFKVDGGAWLNPAEIIPVSIAANSTTTYTFTATADLSAPGQHILYVLVDYPTDNFRENDTLSIPVYNAPLITVTNTSPYLENFEAGNGSWHADGTNSSWEYGTPASQKINRAASGVKAWKTRLVGHYNDEEQSYLYSPCFDISTLTSPTLSMSIALDLEDCGNGVTCDGAYVEYSTDGNTWSRLGAQGQGTNWYNRAYTGNHMWSIVNYQRWHVATIPIPVASSQLRLRFVMSSDATVFREGIGLDDIHIYSNPNGIYDITGTSPVVTQSTVNGTNWINFVESGSNKLIASVNPLGQDLGSTDVQSYIHTGSVRINSDQYYHNRNITIKPTTVNLPDSASVRFYFLDTETETLINATGCSYCFKPTMAYELGVTKYSDPVDANENGTLADNTPGNYLFINAAKAVKVPFDKGYYAEFKVKDFSEFWLNNGGFNFNTPLPVHLISFTAKKKNNGDVLAEWITASESDVNRYEIEVAKSQTDYQAGRFVRIGQVSSRGNSTTEQHYDFTDLEIGKTGVRYYRLRIVDNDGAFRYSAIRPVVFNDKVEWVVHPNPSTGLFNLDYQVDDGDILHVRIYDVNGRTVKQYDTPGDGYMQRLTIDLRQPAYAKGLYLIDAFTGGRKQVFRVLKQ